MSINIKLVFPQEEEICIQKHRVTYVKLAAKTVVMCPEAEGLQELPATIRSWSKVWG